VAWIAILGPELEENLSLRHLASSFAAAGYASEILTVDHDADVGRVLAEILERARASRRSPRRSPPSRGRARRAGG
jgi:hypothetical protein